VEVGRQVEQRLTALVEKYPNDPRLTIARRGAQKVQVGVWLRSGRPADAEAVLLRYLEVSPGDPDGLLGLAQAQAVQGKHAEAEKTLRRLKDAAARMPMWQNNLAWKLVTDPDPRVRNAAVAVEMAKKAVAQAPDNGTFWNTLGVAHYRAGDDRGAVAALGKSMALRGGGDAFDWYFLAMARHRLGEREGARKDLTRAVTWANQNEQDNDELIRFRAEAEAALGVAP
jgi:Flp pilus assembly protein TadD